jgi:hypothetical protein
MNYERRTQGLVDEHIFLFLARVFMGKRARVLSLILGDIGNLYGAAELRGTQIK